VKWPKGLQRLWYYEPSDRPIVGVPPGVEVKYLRPGV